jgi:hypothetical protein
MLRALACVSALLAVACGPDIPPENWTCDFDASESRPLGEPDATPDDAGILPTEVCQETCGPPANSCTATMLEGGVPGAVCPVCTF